MLSWHSEEGHWDLNRGDDSPREYYDLRGKRVSKEYAHGRGKYHWRRGAGKRVLRALGKVVKIVAVVSALDTLFREGAVAAARELMMADEVEAIGSIVRDSGQRLLSEAQESAGGWYRRRGGLSDAELKEYGLAY